MQAVISLPSNHTLMLLCNVSKVNPWVCTLLQPAVLLLQQQHCCSNCGSAAGNVAASSAGGIRID